MDFSDERTESAVSGDTIEATMAVLRAKAK